MLFLVLPSLASPSFAANDEKDENRLINSGTVLKEILDVPDHIPQDLLDKTNCVVVFPSVLKAAFIVGGSYGRGAMSCRKGQDFSGSWGAPTMMALEGGSFGFQIGGEATDFVLLIMNEPGASGILTSNVKLGADASAAAGPVGRTTSAETDATFACGHLELFSCPRRVCRSRTSRGLPFVPTRAPIKEIYGHDVPAREIVLSGNVAIPPAAQVMISTLDSKTPKHKS
jgi:SH3 domain-containing YSC84-like protein 1